MKRRFGRRTTGGKPAVTWSDISTNWVFASVTATSTSALIQLQSPSSLAALTSDPPEDLTVLRVVGDWTTTLTTTTAVWTLALTVADVTWTPGATMSVDNDKRILWSQQYWGTALQAGGAMPVTIGWSPPGHILIDSTTDLALQCPREAVHIDIAPRVRIEPGKALYLVAYEEQGSGALTVLSYSMRVLYKRSGRRSR